MSSVLAWIGTAELHAANGREAVSPEVTGLAQERGVEMGQRRGPVASLVQILAEQVMVESRVHRERFRPIALALGSPRVAAAVQAIGPPQMVSAGRRSQPPRLVEELEALLGRLFGVSQDQEHLEAAFLDLVVLARREALRQRSKLQSLAGALARQRPPARPAPRMSRFPGRRGGPGP